MLSPCLFPSHQAPKALQVVRMAPSVVARRVLFARGIITGLYTVLITMVMAEGAREICASASVAHFSLCPFTYAFSLHGPDSFLLCQTANLCKVINWTNSKLMSSTSSQRVVKLSSLTSFLIHTLYLV